MASRPRRGAAKYRHRHRARKCSLATDTLARYSTHWLAQCQTRQHWLPAPDDGAEKDSARPRTRPEAANCRCRDRGRKCSISGTSVQYPTHRHRFPIWGNSLRVPRRCPHDDKCCEKAHNTFHMTWKCAHDSGFQAVCLKYWAKALRLRHSHRNSLPVSLILYLRDLGELLLSARAVNDTNK